MIPLLLARIVAALIALPLTLYAARALCFVPRGGGLLSLIVGSASALAALLAWWFALRGHLPQARSRIAAIFDPKLPKEWDLPDPSAAPGAEPPEEEAPAPKDKKKHRR